MKRKLILLALCATAILSIGALTACGNDGSTHKHVWNDGEVTRPASCSATGVITYTCTLCGETKTDIIAKTEHPYADEWLYNDDEHWHATTCEHTTERACVGEHSWDTREVITAATCLNAGLVKYTCVCGKTKTEVVAITDHDYNTEWSYNDDKHWHVCATDGCDEIADEADHNWDSGKITVEPTCISEGELVYTCTDCGKTKTETVGKTAHIYGDTLSADENGHFHACTTPGCTAKIDETAHSYGDWDITTGQTAKICETCGYIHPAQNLTTSRNATVTVRNGEPAGITLFSMLKGYYTVTCTTTAEITFNCVYYDRIGNRYEDEFTVSPNGESSFTIKLEERSVCCIIAVSTASENTDCELSVEYSSSAPQHIHTFDTEWSSDENYHWHACTGADCEEETDTGLHEFDGDVCTVCGYDRSRQ